MFNRAISRRILSSFVFALLCGPTPNSTSAIAAYPESAQTIAGNILSVGDGDTIRVRTADKILTIRLACIDAPEMKQQPYGASAANRLKQLLPVGQTVLLNIVDTDRYDRKVAKVYAGNLSVNLTLVEEGYAAIYTQYLKGCPELRDRLLSAEASAKSRRLGLWTPTNPVMPWDFRRSHSAKSNSARQSRKTLSNKQPARSSTSQTSSSSSTSRVDWSKAQQDIDAGRYSNGVNSIDSSDGSYSGSFSGSGSGGSCNNPSDRDSAGRSCGGRAASERSGGR
jgi:micrococcal nuclease